MNAETRTTTERRRADIFREICREIRRAEKATDERRRREYKPAHTRPISTTTTRSGHAQTVRTRTRGRPEAAEPHPKNINPRL